MALVLGLAGALRGGKKGVGADGGINVRAGEEQPWKSGKSMTSESSVFLEIDPAVPEEHFTDFRDELRADQLEVGVVRRPLRPFAGLEWTVPTLVIAYIVKPYFETMLTKMAEDHYVALKKATGRLWPKFFGPKPEIRCKLVSHRGIKESIFSGAFSVNVESVGGARIALRFLNNTASGDFNLAIEKFVVLMIDHHSCGGSDPLSGLIESQTFSSPHGPHVIYMNPVSKKLELIDAVQSARLKRLVSDVIPSKPT